MSRRAPAGVGPVSGPTPATFTYTPTITQVGNTFSAVSAQVTRLPGLLVIQGTFQAVSSIASVALTISLPSGYAAAPATAAVVGVGSLSNQTDGSQIASLSVTSGASVITAPSMTTTAMRAYPFLAVVPVAL